MFHGLVCKTGTVNYSENIATKLQSSGKMECFYYTILLNDVPKAVATSIYAYMSIVAVLNTSGNAFLIYALHRTGQTGTLSLQFILFMSISDAIFGVNSLMGTIWFEYGPRSDYCWFYYASQFMTGMLGTFSTLMIIIIALDRYLHMKLLERYPIVFTKKRGYYLVIGAVLVAGGMSILIALPRQQQVSAILKTLFFTLTIPMCVTIILIYNHACRALQTRTNQLARNIITKNRALGKAAKRITLCAVVLITQFAIVHGLYEHIIHLKAVNVQALKTSLWLAFINYQCNGFFNSIIFLAYNKPARFLLKRILRGICHRRISVAGRGENES